MLGIAFALLFALMLGVASIFSRRGLETGSFDVLLFFSLAVASPIFLLIAFLTGGFSDVTPVGLAYAAAGSILGSVAARSLYFLGINHLGPGKSLSITATSPLYAAVLAWFVLDETITQLVALGTLLIVLGIVGISKDAREETERSGRSLLVMLYPATGAVLASVAVTFRKLALDLGVAPIEVGTVNMVVGFLVVTPLIIATRREELLRVDRRTSTNFAIASFIMAFGFIFYFIGLQSTDASIFFPLTQTQPFFAVALSAVFLRQLEIISPWTIGASASIVGGATLVVIG